MHFLFSIPRIFLFIPLSQYYFIYDYKFTKNIKKPISEIYPHKTAFKFAYLDNHPNQPFDKHKHTSNPVLNSRSITEA